MTIITKKAKLIAAPEPPQPPIVFSLVESMGGQWTLSVSSGGLGYGDDLCAYDSEICHEKLDYYDGETLIGTAERDNEGGVQNGCNVRSADVCHSGGADGGGCHWQALQGDVHLV